VRLRSAPSAPWTDYEGAVVMSEQPHQFDGCGRSIAQLFVEPETGTGAALREDFGGSSITPLPGARVAELAEPLFARIAATPADAPMLEAAAAALAGLVGCSEPARRDDVRVVRPKALLRSRLAATPTLTQLAEAVHLSPSRLRHLFVAQTGSSFRAYLLGLRLHMALAAFNRGGNWTQAAHAAGFADSAHLSRTFRRMFGISPVMLVLE
jgi:AraC-like DNA-binding protein